MNAQIRIGLAVSVLGAVTTVAPVAAGSLRQSPTGCTLTVDKVASPARIRLGESVQIRLSVTPSCPPASFRAADIILAIDESRSMLTSGKLDAARAAARTFIQVTDLTLHQIGVVAFAENASLIQGLTTDQGLALAAIDNLVVGSGTNIAEAIDFAFQELQDHGRPTSLPVIILITDGAPNRPRSDPTGAAIRSANFAKLGGTEIFSIGVGPDVDANLMEALASATANYYYAPDASDLEIVYRTIAVLVGDYAVRDFVLEDDLTTQVTYVTGSSSPAAVVNGRNLKWSQGLVPTGGLSWVYQVTPTVTGTYATNIRALGTYRSAVDDPLVQVTFPVPLITVLDRAPPEPSICTFPFAWTVMVHSFPDVVGATSKGTGCNNRFDSGDWAGSTNVPLPKLKYQLSDLSGNALYTGEGVPGPGRVDQWLYIRVCTPPPYRLRLLTADLGAYSACGNSPTDRIITRRNFRPEVFQRTEARFGYAR